VLACLRCNQLKGDKTVGQFLSGAYQHVGAMREVRSGA
jgi:hypothetical protein